MAGKFFDVKYLMNMTDMHGEQPEIFIVCSRVRGPGKTTSVGMMVLNKAIETGEKFVLVCRKKAQVGNYAEGCLKGAAELIDESYTIEERTGIKGLYSNIYLTRKIYDEENNEEGKEEIHVGYVVALRGAYEIKNISSLFVDSWCSIQDEFITQDNSYLPDEPRLLQNLHTSLARGKGKSIRYYPHFMMANCIDILNPYFIAFGLVGQIQSNTKKYKGDGVVYMRYENETIAKEHAESKFNRAFKGYSNENEFQDNSWLVDTSSLCGKPDTSWGYPQYQYNIHDGKIWMRVAYFYNTGLYMIDYGKEQGLTTYAVHEPEIGECVWDAPGVRVRKLLREVFKSGQLRFRTEQVKRDYLERL